MKFEDYKLEQDQNLLEKEKGREKCFDLLSGIDNRIDPGKDFYQYAIGKQIENYLIPEENSEWGSIEMAVEKNNVMLQELLEDAANGRSSIEGSIVRKIGDFYISGMDEEKIEKEGISPLQEKLDKIDFIENMEDFAKELARMHKYATSQSAIASPLFSIHSSHDKKNSNIIVAEFTQGGMGLSNKDLYFDNDDYSKKVRAKYLDHLKNMFVLLGYSENIAKEDAEKVMNIETDLATVSMKKEDLYDSTKTYNKMSLDQLIELSPEFNWRTYFEEIGLKKDSDLNIAQTDFFKGLGEVIKNVSLDDLKTYLRLNLIRNNADYLSNDFVKGKFDFYDKFLNGTGKIKPRRKRVTETANDCLGNAVGQIYAKEYFLSEHKEKVMAIADNIINVFCDRIKNSQWEEETKNEALKKLDACRIKIGHPEKCIDYSDLEIKKDSYLENIFQSNHFKFKNDIAKIGKPADKNEWQINPQKIDGRYSSENNDVTIPEAILQSPFFDPEADDAVNYGALGYFIAHEIMHGFDGEGMHYDSKGNFRDWRTEKDKERFENNSKTLIDEFNKYIVIDGLNLNGKLTLQENVADLEGVSIAFEALEKSLKNKKTEKINGFTSQERFFLSYAKIFASNILKECLESKVKTSFHAPRKARVNMVLSYMPEFAKTFNLSLDDPMNKSGRLKGGIWHNV